MPSWTSKNKVTVFKRKNNKFKWVCPYCLTNINDEFCKVGYSITCTACKKELTIKNIV